MPTYKGGAYAPDGSYDRTGATDSNGTYSGSTLSGTTTIGAGATITNPTISGATITSPTLSATGAALTTPIIDGVAYSANNDRQIIVDTVAVSGATVHAAVTAYWTAPAAAMIRRVIFNVTTKSTGASTTDIGYTAVSATTGSDSLLDGIDSGTATGIYDSMDPALDSGANAHVQLADNAKWITVQEKTGDITGLVGTLTVEYTLV